MNAELVVFLCGLWLEGPGQRVMVLLMKGEQGRTEKVKRIGCSEPRSNVE